MSLTGFPGDSHLAVPVVPAVVLAVVAQRVDELRRARVLAVIASALLVASVPLLGAGWGWREAASSRSISG